MSNHERRSAVALDEAFEYCTRLETNSERPVLYRLCNAIRTLDLALESHEDSPIPITLSSDAWSRIRDSLFNALVSSFEGQFEIYDVEGNWIQPTDEWPLDGGRIEFYPKASNRRNDSYQARLDRLNGSVVTCLRWCLAEGRLQITPSDVPIVDENSEKAPDDTRVLLDRLYEICAEQATEGKKKAHRKWWQIYWEASSCPNKREKQHLQKQLVAIQDIWGRPAQ